jgi:hypothetical protein
MKKLLFPQRLRETPAGVLAPAEARRPFRLWMTGSLAVVMAAMIPMRDVSESDRLQAMRLLRHSRFDVSETVQRIEAAARDRGLPVLALMPGARPVLVLASSVGGTLVVMQEADSNPAMPLSVMVRAGAGGGSEVLVAAANPAAHGWPDLPSAVFADVQALPGLVERALS